MKEQWAWPGQLPAGWAQIRGYAGRGAASPPPHSALSPCHPNTRPAETAVHPEGGPEPPVRGD